MLVVDTSVTLSWLIPDEFSQNSDHLLQQYGHTGFSVAHVWPSEVANGLASCARRGRMGSESLQKAYSMLGQLKFFIDDRPQQLLMEQNAELAIQTGLSAYDASYINLALYKNVMIASFDEHLVGVAKKLGISIWEI